MAIDQLIDWIRATPFEPFDLVMPNGEKLHVPHQDFIWVLPDRRSVAVALTGGVMRLVNWQMVAALEKKSSVQ